MEEISTVADLRARLEPIRAAGGRVGMVGTSGAVHEGHQSLVRASAADNDITVMFWGGGARFDWMNSELQYERDFDRDRRLVEEAGADALFVPLDSELFPRAPFTQVSLPAMSSGAPGLEDPAHLDLIAMVMAKLWNMFGPCRSYFGEKDWQQLAMYKRMADDLCWPVEVVGCPTVRHDDGVAVSSRNSQLSPEARAAAPALYRALRAARDAVAAGVTSQERLATCFADAIGDAGRVEYFVAVDAETMAKVDPLVGEVRMLASMGLGSVRLVDNIGVTVAGGGS
ncbi:MAG: pantoate--beta-alanine ligase [Actinomycetota bacterium]|nr:pantoate--beta-alanine ligase [Actinomycetota bacterium]